MFEANKGQAAPLKGQELSIGIVQARFNEGVTNALAARAPSREREIRRLRADKGVEQSFMKGIPKGTSRDGRREIS